MVNVLKASHQHISEQFAAPAVDKFDTLSFRPGIDGVPVLIDALASIECRLQHAYDGGDHTIFVGKVEHVTTGQGTPLIYHQAEYKKINS